MSCTRRVARTGHVQIPSPELDSLIIDYFKSWRPYTLILKRLRVIHGVWRSKRWLKAQLMRLNLRKRCRDPPHLQICQTIREILMTSDAIMGYRSVWKILREKYGMVVRRDTVMRLLKTVDPHGVFLRSKRKLKRRTYHTKGPNHIWHADGYDKLSPFGLTIHGCIDGFSRRLLWLRVCPTNHNPRVIVYHYLKCVKQVGGCPMMLRCDYGTENTCLATAQIAFRMHHGDSLSGAKSFVYGPSKSNIRIESFWSQLKKSKTSWWIDKLKDLEVDGNFDGSIFHRQCLAFCCAELLQEELDTFKISWNSHKIRPSRHSDSPDGYPDDMYDMPELYGGEECIKDVNEELWHQAMIEESQPPPPFYSRSFEINAANLVVEAFDLSHDEITSTNWKSVYLHMIDNYEYIHNPSMEMT